MHRGRRTRDEQECYDRGFVDGRAAMEKRVVELEKLLKESQQSVLLNKSVFTNQVETERKAKRIAEQDAELKDKWVTALSTALSALLEATRYEKAP